MTLATFGCTRRLRRFTYCCRNLNAVRTEVQAANDVGDVRQYREAAALRLLLADA